MVYSLSKNSNHLFIVFKNIGEDKDFKLRESGHTHIFRIVSSHIDYIDRYRITLMKSGLLDNHQKKEINKVLLDVIRKYLEILEFSYDRTIISTRFLLFIAEKIEVIEESGYSDMTTQLKVFI